MRRLKALAAPLFVVAVLLVAAELALRALFPDLRYFENRSGVTGGVEYRMNSLGMRDAEFPLKKPPGVVRILCMGDSTTFGMSERLEDSWPKALERMLNEQGRNVHVVNGAGVGRHPHIQFELFRDRYWEVEPDLVALGFCLNDVVVRTAQLDQERFAQEVPSAPLSIRLAQSTRTIRHALARFYIFGAAQYVGSRFFPTYDGDELTRFSSFQFNAFGFTPESERAWADTLESLDGLVTEIRRHGADVVIVPIPYRFLLSRDARDNERGVPTDRFQVDPIARLREFGRRRRIPVADTLGRLTSERVKMHRGDVPYDPLYVPFDYVHPNARGYHAIAEAAAVTVKPLLERQAVARLHRASDGTEAPATAPSRRR